MWMGARELTTDIPAWHEVLGVRPGASREDILAAYRRHAKSCHPDTGGNAGLFRLLGIARDQGLNGENRLAEAAEPQATRQPGAADTGWHHRDDSGTGRPPAEGSPHPVADFLARLPAPQTDGGWMAAFAVCLIGGGVLVYALHHIAALAVLAGVLAVAALLLMAVADAIRAKRRRRAWEHFQAGQMGRGW